MIWPLLVIAILSSIVAGIACFALGIRKVPFVVPIQIAFSFAVTYAVAVRMAREGREDDTGLVFACLAAAAALPVLWLVLRRIFGPIARREGPPPAPGARRAHHH